MSTTTPIPRQCVFTLRFMAGIAYIASPIPRLISLEVVEAHRAALRQRSSVTVMRIKAIVHMAIKPAMPVEPWASSNKQPADTPIGPIVAIGSAVIGRVVKVTIRTHGRRSNVDPDGNLGLRHRCTA
jgi:hypothetical protein